MNEFRVENRNRGVILVHGTIEDGNQPKADEFDQSFDRSQWTEISKAISADLKKGYDGGQLPFHGLEWFKILAN